MKILVVSNLTRTGRQVVRINTNNPEVPIPTENDSANIRDLLNQFKKSEQREQKIRKKRGQ